MKYTIWIALLSACGGGGGGGVSPSEFPAAIAEVTCSRLAECCTTEEFMDETLGSDDEAECKAIFTGFGGLLADVIEDSVAAGRLIYHGDRVQTCLDVIAGLSCADFQTEADIEGSACQDPFEGLVENGGECANDFDCVSNYCSGDSLDFEGNIMFGACIDAPVAGQPCDDNDCADGAFCDRSGETPTCAPLLADGASCNLSSECLSDNCDDTGTCSAERTCDGM